MYNDLAYAPFGETYAQAGSTGVTDVSFAGNNEDTTTNLYDAQFREYGIQGRWPSPDPAGVAAANPANPQSWNRYAYVVNNPLLYTDPSGLQQGLRPMYECGDDGFGCNILGNPFGGGGCTLNGVETYCSIVESVIGAGAADIAPPGVGEFPWIPSGAGSPYGGKGCYTNTVTDQVWCPNSLDNLQLGTVGGLQINQDANPAPQSPTIGPYKPLQPTPPQPQKVTPGCMTGALINNFIGSKAQAGATFAVNIAAAVALRLVKQTAPGDILPGPGWVYAATAVLWDVGMVAKSYVDCKYGGGPSQP